MPSPFPGMDPYLEPHWLDVHTKLVTYAADDLNSHLPQDLIASTEERVAVESEDGDERFVGPDVRVSEPPAPATTVVGAAGATATAPYRLIAPLARVEPSTERFIRIIEAGTERLVTVIEFVSPTNKRGDGLRAFRAKRAELLRAGINFVEVDLVRAGDWRALLRPHLCPREAVSLYRITVRLPGELEAAYLRPVSLRDSLPEITIPLREQDPPVPLGLQKLLDQAYANGRYFKRLDYDRPLNPPLDATEAAWVAELLRGRGGAR